MGSLKATEDELRAQIDEMERSRFSLYSAPSRAVFEERLRELRQSVRLARASMERVRTPDFQMRNFYPYPLAFPYRLLSGIPEPGNHYQELLRVAENSLAFLASVMLALAGGPACKAAQIQITPYWQGGISPGHWRELCQRTRDVLLDLPRNDLYAALAGLWNRRGRAFC